MIENDALRVGDRVYSLNARELPAEGAVLTVVRDRTEELRRELSEREFVSNAAHELRNPIAGISGSVEVLRAGAKDDPEARDHFLMRLSEDAERISRLTESLLDPGPDRGGGRGWRRVAGRSASRSRRRPRRWRRPRTWRLAIEVASDMAATGDRVLLRQVLIGLLTNAYKNTPPPGQVTVRAVQEADGSVRIEVEDTGTGIAPEEVDRVFERFYRGTGSLEKEGFGLGLSIARRMVDVMGGEIGVRSEPGAGSTFWIRLRAARPAATPVA